ncbi:hypothetical protein ACFY05_43295 [Microtetraspora fusca]|uniref:Uncharacterized protein n=1 Tax=Microtetraspora fusca TaxID=1997 RepID=A0ABW6VJX7_MICFU
MDGRLRYRSFGVMVGRSISVFGTVVTIASGDADPDANARKVLGISKLSVEVATDGPEAGNATEIFTYSPTAPVNSEHPRRARFVLRPAEIAKILAGLA